ncbi:MAG TPA: hypothetical protein VJ529_00750 [Candidatus Bathyarchaeia archaeon]|nr:hypothetical protein [Candidatus Bathyarchaeia archaeon]
MRKQKSVTVDGSERLFKAYVVWLVLNGKAEESLQTLANHYKVHVPRLKVGLPSRHRARTLGCYVGNDETIYLLNAEAIMNPFILLHEFYHHLRMSIDKQHKGTEKYADRFAREFLAAYCSCGVKP